jgi:hypothetical protein
MEKRLRRKRELASATAAFPPRWNFRQRVDRQAAAMWAERLALICRPANALERVARFVIRHAYDLREGQRASGGAEQEMLRQGANPCKRDWPSRRRRNRAPTRLYSDGRP